MYLCIYIYEDVKKQQETCKTYFFSGHNFSRKRKTQNKNIKTIQKQTKKNQSITFCCGDFRNKQGVGVGTQGPGLPSKPGTRRNCRVGWLGPDCSLQGKGTGPAAFCS